MMSRLTNYPGSDPAILEHYWASAEQFKFSLSCVYCRCWSGSSGNANKGIDHSLESLYEWHNDGHVMCHLANGHEIDIVLGSAIL